MSHTQSTGPMTTMHHLMQNRYMCLIVDKFVVPVCRNGHPQASPHAALYESTLEDLRLLEVIGSGSSGTVRKAMHRATGTVLVLKVCTVKRVVVDSTQPSQSIPFNTGDDAARKQVKAELRTLYDAHHPNLVRFYQSFFSDGAISILMEVSRKKNSVFSHTTICCCCHPVNVLCLCRCPQ